MRFFFKQQKNALLTHYEIKISPVFNRLLQAICYVPLQIILDLVLQLFLKIFFCFKVFFCCFFFFSFGLRGKAFFHFSFFNDLQPRYLVLQLPGLGIVTPAASDLTAGLIFVIRLKALKGLTTEGSFSLKSLWTGYNQIDSYSWSTSHYVRFMWLLTSLAPPTSIGYLCVGFLSHYFWALSFSLTQEKENLLMIIL